MDQLSASLSVVVCGTLLRDACVLRAVVARIGTPVDGHILDTVVLAEGACHMTARSDEIHGFAYPGAHMTFPGVAVHLCLRGTARIIYDMQEITIGKNNLMVMMPGHFMRAIECSDDFTYARTVVSSALLNDINAHLFSHDSDKFNNAPSCQLTDEQADRLLANGKLLSAIAMHDTADLQLRRQMLLSQIAVGYEFVNYYRKEQDHQWSESQTANLYARFCDLVVAHHREHRDVQFYAAQLGYSTRYFSKLFLKSSNGITALDYIGQ